MTRVLLAPDKFKGTLTAAEVAGYLAEGIRACRPEIELATVPVADGGDGLLDAFETAGFKRVRTVAAGPSGTSTATSYVRRGPDAVIELAAVSGLAALGDDLAPLTATSRGVGEVIAAALDAGCTHIVLGIGGSACTDGGIGMLQALGALVLDRSGAAVGDGGLGAQSATRLVLTGLHPLLERANVEVACDVDNPLTGATGAAAVYGPQKGASPEQVALLDSALTGWADVVAATTGRDLRDTQGAGAAGGVGFAAVAVLGASLRPGVDVVLELIGFAEHLVGADLVVTGEGSLDEQTLHGKAPAGVAAAARAQGVPVVAVAGRCLLDAGRLRVAGFDAVHTLLEESAGTDEAFTAPGPLLRAIGARIAEGIVAARP
ncbi:MAG: glycerate kinase [Jatrophihabitantaceae bacterium]